MLRKVLFQLVTASALATLFALPAPVFATGCPSTVSIIESANRERVGDAAGTEQRLAQKFAAPCTGAFTGFQLKFRSTIGSPTGSFHWSLVGDSFGVPGAALVSGDITPTASAVNTVTSGSVTVNEGASYWLVMWADNQANDNSWGIEQGTTSAYTGGNCFRSTNGGSTWSDTSGDCYFVVTVGTITATDTPTATGTTGPTATPSNTPTPTPTNTPDYFIVATFEGLTDYPITVRPTATMGEISVSGVGIVLIGVVGLFFVSWLVRRR